MIATARGSSAVGHAAIVANGVATELVEEITQRLEPLAYHMVNEGEDVPRLPLRP